MAILTNRISIAGDEATGDNSAGDPLGGAHFLSSAPGRQADREPTPGDPSSSSSSSSRDELLRHHAALLDAQREQRELTELIVHDLKAPLMALRTGLEWMRGHLWPGQDDLADALTDANAAANRLGAMIGDLLAVSRMDQGNLPLHRQSVRLRNLFDVIVHSYARRAGEKGIELSRAPGDDEPEVQADPTLLQRVMENLVENALRYTQPNGRICLSAARRPEPRTRVVEIAVSNDGPPIPLPERARIFHKFARGRAEGAVAGSAGLGLYFCKRAIEAHGGAIAVVETPDWPTSFRITLP